MKNTEYYFPKNNFSENTIGKEPNWLIKSGISILSGLMVLLFVASYLIHYPDKLNSKIIITSNDPPIRLTNLSGGTINKLFVKDGDSVQKDQRLYYIDNQKTDLNHIERLKEILIKPIDSLLLYDFKEDSINPGELLASYQNLYEHLINYRKYLQFNPDSLQISVLEGSLRKHNNIGQILKKKISLMEKRVELEKRKNNRQSELYEKGVIAKQEKESFEIDFFEISEDYYLLLSEKANLELKILDIKDQIITLNNKSENTIALFKEEFKNNINSLLNEISSWESMHFIKSPINGKVAFLKHDILNIKAAVGDQEIAVIPFSFDGVVLGKMFTPLYNTGNIKVGDQVNIFLDNYPYQEFGVITGKINSISTLPIENNYLIKVNLPEGLKTKSTIIPFTEELSGTAEIILEEKSLFIRIFQKIFYQNKNNY